MDFFLKPKLSGYGEVGSLQSLACLAIENLVRKSLDQVGMQTTFLSEISIYTFIFFEGRELKTSPTLHDHDNHNQVKDPGCRALISLTPEQQERAETIHSFVQVSS